MRPVGILGGMGPEATILLMQKCLAAVDAADDADHIPLIVHQNPQVPSRIAALIQGTGPDPTPTLTRMARDLAAAGAQALAMPCNTAHHYTDAIVQATALPFLDMTEASAENLGAGGARRIGMICSPAVRLTGAFDRAFGARGLGPLYPHPDAPVLDAIRAVKAGQRPDAAALRQTAEALLSQGADRILIACTELSLATDAFVGLPVIDSLDCLVDRLVSFARGPG